MATFASGGHRTVGIAPRAALAIAGLLLIGAGVWFATSWIDTSSDSTCGAVIYPSMWLDDAAPSECRTTMAIRWGISATVGIIGAGLLYIAAVARRPIAPARAATILAAAVATSTALLLINEAVRSDGAL